MEAYDFAYLAISSFAGASHQPRSTTDCHPGPRAGVHFEVYTKHGHRVPALRPLVFFLVSPHPAVPWIPAQGRDDRRRRIRMTLTSDRRAMEAYDFAYLAINSFAGVSGFSRRSG